MNTNKRPAIVEDQHLEYLNTCRRLGIFNMFSAPMHLAKEFGLTKKEAAEVFVYWMTNFKEEDR